MAAGVGSLIQKSDFDTIKAKADLIFGTGSGQSGYGQTITSSSPAAQSVILAATWVNLRNDMIKARQHQTGTTVGLSQLNLSGTISSSANTTTITGIGSTSGLVAGTPLTKVSGVGNFGSSPTILSVDSATQITITASTANVAGAIVFDAFGTTGTDLFLPTSGATITERIRNQFDSFSNLIITDKFLVGAGQTSPEGLVTGTRTTGWNSTVTHVVTITGATGGDGSAANLRYFFNAGGSIRVSASRTGGTAGSAKNAAWDQMFSQMGEFVMNYTQTTFTGSSATGSAIGWYDLTTTDQQIASKTAPAGTYSSNLYRILARRSADSSQLILTIEFQDNAGPNPNIDELVDGTLSSIIQQNRPSGTNVSVLTPTATNTSGP